MRDREKTATTRLAGALIAQPGLSDQRPAAGFPIRPGDQLLYKIPEVMRMLRMSRSVVFEQLRNGRLRSVRQGRARLIPAAAIIEYLDLLEREAQEGAASDDLRERRAISGRREGARPLSAARDDSGNGPRIVAVDGRHNRAAVRA